MAEFAAIGTSGVSLALGLYNSAQISSMKDEISALSSITEPVLTPDGNFPEEVISTVAPLTPIVQTTVVESESPEIADLQKRLSDVESFANVVGTRSTSNLSKVTIAADDINRLETHVTSELVDIRSTAAQNGNDIATNAASIGMVEVSIGDIVSDLNIVQENANSLSGFVTDVSGSLDTTVSRVATLESNQETISSGLSNLTLTTDALGDNLDLVDGLGQDTKSNLESLTSAWNAFNATAFVANGILGVSNLSAELCNIGFQSNKGDTNALHFNTLQASNWTMYLANKTGLTPDGNTPSSYGAVTGYALRARLDANTANGFMFENSSGEGIYSITSGGVSTQKGNSSIANAKVGDLGSEWCGFSNTNRFSSGGFAIAQKNDGQTTVNSANSKTLGFSVNGTRRAYCASKTSFVIDNPTGEWDTIFNHVDSGNNYIRSDSSTTFHFNSASAGSTVITKGEVTVDGVAVKAKLADLESRLAAMEAKNFIVSGNSVYMKNSNNSKLLRKASSNNDVIVDSSSQDSRSKWQITEA